MELSCYYFRCPHCKSWYSTYEYISYTVNSSECYSDGKCNTNVAPILPFAKCEKCQKLFWISDTDKVDDRRFGEIQKQYSTITKDQRSKLIAENQIKEPELSLIECIYEQPETEKVHDHDYPPFLYEFDAEGRELFILDIQLAISELANNSIDRETDLRLYLWWTINDLIRYDDTPLHFWSNLLQIFRLIRIRREDRIVNNQMFIKYANLKQKNLELLVKIFRPQNPDESIIYIGILQALQRFDEAKRVLEDNKTHFPKKYIAKMKKHLRRKSTKVFEY